MGNPTKTVHKDAVARLKKRHREITRELRAEIQRKDEALRVYADQGKWLVDTDHGVSLFDSLDCGEIARKALQPKEGE